jgi:hypothetical protein
VKLHPEDRVVARIDELFSIDAKARSANLDPASRHRLRLEQARPLLDLLKPQVEAIRRDALPVSTMDRIAATFGPASWPEFCRRLKISVRDYADRPIRHTKQLTPAAWAATNRSNSLAKPGKGFGWR